MSGKSQGILRWMISGNPESQDYAKINITVLNQTFLLNVSLFVLKSF